jgi:hypothetical protein
MNENVKWFGQSLLTFKDKQYDSDGYLRISLSTNTEDHKYFNPPMLALSIQNQHQKQCNLNIQNAEDLLESFTIALKQLNGDDTIIEKHYSKHTKMYFRFAIASSTEERVVVIELISSETDAVKIIVPLKPTFQSFLRRLRFFVENYDRLCMDLMLKAIDHESVSIIQNLPGLIKGISSQIVSQIPADSFQSSDTPAPEREIAEKAEKTSYTIDALDNFIGGDDMSNIKIPEIEEKKIEEAAPLVEIQSNFVEKVLKYDLANLESKLSSFSVTKNPMMDIVNDIEQSLDFKVLDGIEEDDLKSIVYISTLNYGYITKDYTINEVPIPERAPVIKFKPKEFDENHVELAKDIVTIVGYVRTLRRRLESKTDNSYDNKAIMYLALRCFFDPMCFSYLEKMSRSDLVSSIKNRYLYFDQAGMFDKYKQMLKDFNCSDIDVTDIVSYSEEVFDKIIGKTQMINIYHEQSYRGENIKLPSKNTLDLEQITNEFIPVEINWSLGMDLENDENIQRLKEQYNVSDEVFNYFIEDKKKRKVKKQKKITPLQRWVNDFKQDIPEQYRKDVIAHVEKMEYQKFNFQDCPWPLDEFDERIVKGFYVWDPDSDPKMKSNFAHFASLIENEPMTKENILLSTKIEKSDGWAKLADFV